MLLMFYMLFVVIRPLRQQIGPHIGEELTARSLHGEHTEHEEHRVFISQKLTLPVESLIQNNTNLHALCVNETS